ncbi:hypothetical protein [Nitrosomonas sp. Nm34]|uniref:hypothetical protein n=1 Tax=Nitrosomonas sp. Nm34 TaxID=1881055 RepID=UPI0008F26013|nr:hypothetical protein [Nitrosomonas sp. Nm34]SFI75039.1 hypothetical protein SAMN05428978_103229 [Nitrosomonas sp. Nm34]
MGIEQLPKRITFEFTGEIRHGYPGEYWMGIDGLLRPVFVEKSDREWPIYRVVELEK